MQELRFKIRGGDTSNIEIVPTEDGVEVVVHYGSKQSNCSGEKQVYKKKSTFKNANDILDEMKAAAREEYKKDDCNKNELKKFVCFWEKKIQDNGWKGDSFNFEVLYERWLSKIK